MENFSSSSPTPVTLTAREAEIFLFAIQSLKEGCELQVDYEKLRVKSGHQNAASAKSSWSAVKKKVFAGATHASSDVAKPKTPRKVTVSKAEDKTETKADADDAHVSDKPDKVDGIGDSQMRGIALREAKGRLEISDLSENGEAEMKETSAAPAKVQALAVATGRDVDSEMVDNSVPTISTHKGKGKASAVDDLSAGEQSPSSSTPKAKKAANPRKKKPAKIDTTAPPSSDGAGPSTSTTLSETPSTPKKRGRKPKAKAEGEEDGEQPAKKPRKTPVKKKPATEQTEVNDGVIAPKDDGTDDKLASSLPPTPSTAASQKKKEAAPKKPTPPRKPTAKAAAEAKRLEDEVNAALAESSEGVNEAEVSFTGSAKAGTEEDDAEDAGDKVVVASEGKQAAEAIVVGKEDDTIVVGSLL